MKPIAFFAARLAGALALLEVTTVVVPVAVLGRYFQFPAILRQPAAVALPLFARNQAHVVPAYYVFLASALLFVPLSYALSAALRRRVPGKAALRSMLRGAGLATAIFQTLGFSRWVFAAPYLAAQYTQADPAQRPAVALLYEVLNRYAGLTVGEHLGFLAMGAWTLTLAALLWRAGGWRRAWAAAGALIGLGLLLSTLEHFGGPRAATFAALNLAANTLWSGWLLRVAGWLLLGQTRRAASACAPTLAVSLAP